VFLQRNGNKVMRNTAAINSTEEQTRNSDKKNMLGLCQGSQNFFGRGRRKLYYTTVQGRDILHDVIVV